MLKLERRTGERVIVGGDVIVEVLEVRGQIVKLGFDAPRSIRIYREEIWLAVKRENEAAALGGDFELPRLPGSVKPASSRGESGPGGSVRSASSEGKPGPGGSVRSASSEGKPGPGGSVRPASSEGQSG